MEVANQVARLGAVAAGDDKRLKVLFVVPGLRGGGVERTAVTVLRHLDRSRFEPHLALVKADGVFLGEVPPDVPVHDLRAGRARYAGPAMVRLTWKLRPQVVLSFMGYLSFVLIGARPLMFPGLKLAVQEVTRVSANLAHDVPYPWMWRWFYRHFYKRADTVMCVSDDIVADLAEHFGVPRGKMVRVYNPVDTERVRAMADAEANPFSTPGPHLVAAGRLSREKAFDLLIDAFALVRQGAPGADLTILGTGPQAAELRARRDRLGLSEAVHMPGFKPNPYPYFKHADLFVLSSHYEGLGNVLLEALSLGTYAVAVDTGGAVREIARYSDGLKLIRPGEPASLGEGLLGALQEAGTRSRKQRPVFLETFGIKPILNSYERLLEGLSHAGSL